MSESDGGRRAQGYHCSDAPALLLPLALTILLSCRKPGRSSQLDVPRERCLASRALENYRVHSKQAFLFNSHDLFWVSGFLFSSVLILACFPRECVLAQLPTSMCCTYPLWSFRFFILVGAQRPGHQCSWNRPKGLLLPVLNQDRWSSESFLAKDCLLQRCYISSGWVRA